MGCPRRLLGEAEGQNRNRVGRSEMPDFASNPLKALKPEFLSSIR
jgi:hypothetical protein